MGSNKISTIDLEEPVVEALNTIDTVADQITDMTAAVNEIKSTLDTVNANIMKIPTSFGGGYCIGANITAPTGGSAGTSKSVSYDYPVFIKPNSSDTLYINGVAVSTVDDLAMVGPIAAGASIKFTRNSAYSSGGNVGRIWKAELS